MARGLVWCRSPSGQAIGQVKVLVSDGENVAATTSQGSFDLPVSRHTRHVFICPPAGFRAKGDFFQHWCGQDSLEFELIAAPDTELTDYAFILLADYQWETNDTMRDVFRRITADPSLPRFIVHVGDLFYMMEGAPVDLARHYYMSYRQLVSEFASPVYNLMGNHDQVNGPRISPEMPEFADGLFEEILGPTYYSFNWGHIHYVVLNSFEMDGMRQRSRISNRQLRWLCSDLALQTSGQPVVVFAHRSPWQMENREALLALLRQHNVVACFAGDWHRDAVFHCPGASFPTIITVGPLENRLGLPPGYRAVWVHGPEVEHAYRTLHSLTELHVVRPGPDSQVSGPVELLVTEHLRSTQHADPAYSHDETNWTPLERQPLPLERTEGCQTSWAQWGACLPITADATLTLRACSESPPSQWIRLPLRSSSTVLLWQKPVSQSGDVLWRSQPAVDGGLVVLGEDDRVRCFRASDGEILWEHEEKGHWLSTPLIVGEYAIITSWESTVLALEVRTGRLIWRTTQDCAAPPSRLSESDGYVFVGGMKRDGIWDGSLTCLRLESGAVCWTRRYDHPYFSEPLCRDGRVWASCGDLVQCIQLSSGKEQWSYQPEHFSLYGPMVIAQRRLLAPDIDGWTYVLDPESGAFLNRRLLPRGTGFASDGQTLYASCGMRGLKAFDPLSLDELWSVHRPGTYFSGHPTLRSRDLVATSSDGNVYVVDQRNGKVTWSHQLGDVDGTTVALEGGRGFLITGDNRLLAFKCPEEAPESQ